MPYTLIILLAAIALRFLTLGSYPLLDPTEARYAEIGRKMLETGNWVTPFIEYNVPFWAKPPLSFWSTAVSYYLFGINEFTARLPSFLFMMATAGVTFLLVLKEKGKDFAWLTLYILVGMPLFFYMAGGVMTDPSLVFATSCTMLCFWQAMKTGNRWWGYGFFLSLALCLLAKGPIGLILTGAPIGLWVLWFNKWRKIWQCLPWISGTCLTLAIALPWYFMAEMRTPGFLHYFIVGEHFERFVVKGWKGDLYGSGRARPIGMVWLFGLLATFPWFIALGYRFFKQQENKQSWKNEWLVFLCLWALFPFIFFTFARNILMSYVVTSLPPIAILAAYGAAKINQRYVAIATAITPLIFIGYLTFLHLSLDKELPSQAAMLDSYRQAQNGQEGQLIYLFDRPYSAVFYSNGKILHAHTVEEAELYAKEGNHNFIVIREDYWHRLPEAYKQSLTVVDQQKNYLLLRR